MSSSGIYCIRHRESGRAYVGSAVNIARRLSRHKTELQNGKHCNQKLLRAWQKYGHSAFSFETLEVVEDAAALVEREQFWIDSLWAVSRGFNICPVAGSCLGVKKDPDAIAKTAAAHRGQKRSEETRAKIREARAKQPPISEEGRARLAAAARSRIVSAETRAKLSAAATGRKMSPEAIEANRRGHIGKRPSAEATAKGVASRSGFRHTDEYRRRMSELQRGRKMKPEWIARAIEGRKAAGGFVVSQESREKISAALKGRPKSEATKRAMSLGQMGRVHSEETRAKIGARSKGRVFSAEAIAKRVATRAANRAAGLHKLSPQ